MSQNELLDSPVRGFYSGIMSRLDPSETQRAARYMSLILTHASNPEPLRQAFRGPTDWNELSLIEITIASRPELLEEVANGDLTSSVLVLTTKCRETSSDISRLLGECIQVRPGPNYPGIPSDDPKQEILKLFLAPVAFENSEISRAIATSDLGWIMTNAEPKLPIEQSFLVVESFLAAVKLLHQEFGFTFSVHHIARHVDAFMVREKERGNEDLNHLGLIIDLFNCFIRRLERYYMDEIVYTLRGEMMSHPPFLAVLGMYDSYQPYVVNSLQSLDAITAVECLQHMWRMPTPPGLHNHAAFPNSEVVQALIQTGVNPNGPGRDEFSVLWDALVQVEYNRVRVGIEMGSRTLAAAWPMLTDGKNQNLSEKGKLQFEGMLFTRPPSISTTSQTRRSTQVVIPLVQVSQGYLLRRQLDNGCCPFPNTTARGDIELLLGAHCATPMLENVLIEGFGNELDGTYAFSGPYVFEESFWNEHRTDGPTPFDIRRFARLLPRDFRKLRRTGGERGRSRSMLISIVKKLEQG